MNTLKFAAGGLMLASVFALVIVGKADAQTYIELITGALGGIGLHAAIVSGASKAPSLPPSTPPQ